MKNIIFDCERMKYGNTGLYAYCLSLGKMLEEKMREDSAEKITFFSPSSVVPLFGRQSSTITQRPLHKFYMPPLNEFDIWHSTYQGSHYIPKRNKKIKVVLSIHDLNFLYEQKTPARRLSHLRHLQDNIDRSETIVCISDFCRNDVLAHCNVGHKKVHVIHNGTNRLTHPVLSESSYRPKRPFLFSLGVMCRKKNFHVLLSLLNQRRNMELLIAGRPDDMDYFDFIKKSARKLRVGEKLRMLGSISENEKSWYYRNCYAFALPSIAEGFGLPVTEAMSVGKPVFLSDRTALPEIGSNFAFYFHDFSAGHMQNVFESGMREYEDKKMQGVIQQHCESFSWEKAAAQYLDVYRSLY